ncbi:hypothetical protein MKW98_011219 [Papaver atlanticum]|uniref:Leucine-rich repeat-containing N-terminal plant-type domain-containing protein n=1 Tax=Papaver atlanticum TaxID=357466 RepID=A0AAD4XKP5_9MAGN|nr:hypothetical protein MKW98_011219 [Papaver atlanticum]
MEFHKRSVILIICVTLVLSSLNCLPTSQHLIAETDRLALLAFKDTINDPLGALTSWNESSHCSNWTGIRCSRRHPSRVVILDLQSMSGIPQEIGHLSRLQELWLANNTLRGKIPRNLSSCKSLWDLVLTQNKLVGGIPVELGSLSMLRNLYLGKNYFSGPSRFHFQIFRFSLTLF